MFEGEFMIDKTDVMTYGLLILSLIVVIGGFVVLVLRSDLSNIVVPMMMLVLGFFFSNGSFRTGVSAGAQAANNTSVK